MRLKLILRYLLSHPLRSLLTCLSIAAATFLLCCLRGIVQSVTAGAEAALSNRLVVQSAVSLYVSLPLTYGPKIASVDGVELLTKYNWFGGVYQDPKNFFAQFACEQDVLFDLYPEIQIVEGSIEAFQASRSAAVVGIQLMDRFGWKLGDTVPLQGAIYPRTGEQAWEFQIAAVYATDAPNIGEQTLYFRHDYFEETLIADGNQDLLGTGVYMLRIAPDADATTVMRDIDALFAAGPQRVQTTTEAEFTRQFATMFGNIPALLSSIGAAVVFAIVLAVLNTMLMAWRERVPSIGIIKALGFSDRSAFFWILLESLILCGAGSLLGIGLALATQTPFATALGTMLPGYRVSPASIGLALLVMALVGTLAAVIPGLAASRLRPVNALRQKA